MATRRDEAQWLHDEWLGHVQPVGLVVSPPALAKAGVLPDRAGVVELQARLAEAVRTPPQRGLSEPQPYIDDFDGFARNVLGWQLEDLAGASDGPEIPSALTVVLADYEDTLRPDRAVLDTFADDGPAPLMVIALLPNGADLDALPGHDGGLHVSPHDRLVRLMWETKVPIGLLCNGTHLRLVYAPRGETSGHATFSVPDMLGVAGRPMLAAMHMLLATKRLIDAPKGKRLGDLLTDSRKYQNEVSTKLAEQILGALWDLMGGFQAADDAAEGRVLFDLSATDPDHVYGGLLTVLMRLVFLLYAEDTGLMPDDEVYADGYSVVGLYQRLRDDHATYPDTMNQRYGAWAWLLSLFRLVFDGGQHQRLHMPARHGALFDPDKYPFLEGRPPPPAGSRVKGERVTNVPKVPDLVVWRLLHKLLVLDGERLSYRALDVEQIGSVYEAMMGYSVQRAEGRSLAVTGKHIVIDLDALLAVPAKDRKKWLADQANCELPDAGEKALKNAETLDDVVAAIGRRKSPRTPDPLPPRSLFLQPGEERRRTGSHYTPRELTAPIVETTLRPVLENLGKKPTPAQILDLKVCDPAMGSGAFLVEACRQLADKLEQAWKDHPAKAPKMPPGVPPLIHARRLVARRCLYGVDKNPFAVDLAKLSLWLITLSKSQQFTFVDHALKWGDSLVGLTREQIAAFHWAPKKDAQVDWLERQLRGDIEAALGWRDKVRTGGSEDYGELYRDWDEAEQAVKDARLIGDVCVAAFFAGAKNRARETLRDQHRELVERWRAGGSRGELEELADGLRKGDKPVPPFHWEIEFPEVFGRENPGFDAMVGNPPFLGSVGLGASSRVGYTDCLRALVDGTGGKADLVAFFFRLGFERLRDGATFGFVATNTISQGDTRESALAKICARGGVLYDVRRRVVWPGNAAVVVSVIHAARNALVRTVQLDGLAVDRISAYLIPGSLDTEPPPLVGNRDAAVAGLGNKPNGKGFIFSAKGTGYLPLELRRDVLAADHRNSEVVRPYVGGKELNDMVDGRVSRWIIDFGERPIELAATYPAAFDAVLESVRPTSNRTNWWQFEHRSKRVNAAIESAALESVLVVAETSDTLWFAQLPSLTCFSNTVVVFANASFNALASLQARVHEVWCRTLSCTMKDDFRYVPAICLDAFPFPPNWQTDPSLESTGQRYYDFRAALMIRNDEGLTKTYNRFHDPDNHEPDIIKLRDLHAAMDRAVLDAYGWHDIPTDCAFLLDYPIDEESWSPRKKKPYRYRWPDDMHDEVLARLLDLNQERYQQEVDAGLHGKGSKKNAARKKAGKSGKKPASKPAGDDKQGDLFGGSDG